jgi:hypothetical protein
MRSRARADEAATLEAALSDRDFALWVEGQVAALRRGDVASI